MDAFTDVATVLKGGYILRSLGVLYVSSFGSST